MNKPDKLTLKIDMSGMGKVWQVFVDNVLVWGHAAIEGPKPDFEDLFNTLMSLTTQSDKETESIDQPSQK